MIWTKKSASSLPIASGGGNGFRIILKPKVKYGLCFRPSIPERKAYRKSPEQLDLTYTQYLVMMVLWEHGGMTEGELGRKIHLESGTLAPLLKRLDKAGLVSRIRPENNERKLFLTLPDKGEALKERAKSVPGSMQGCIPLSENELNTLKNLLCRALAGMETSR